MNRSRVALLFGGRSGEHEVSLVSGASVAGALAERHDVIPVLIDRQGRWLLQSTLAPEGGEPVFLVPAPEERGAAVRPPRRKHDGAMSTGRRGGERLEER